jgi:HK97 family phage prohead protease
MNQIEIRAAADLSLQGKKIIGRPVVYNSPSQDLGGFVEVISAGAFGDSVNSDIRALVEHDQKLILGRTSAGTMTIKEDEQGLLVEIDPPNIQAARDLMTSMERKDISGMSFGFTVNPEGAQWDFDQVPALRTVTSAILLEVTITGMPAYQATNVEVALRSLAESNQSHILKDYARYIEVYGL